MATVTPKAQPLIPSNVIKIKISPGQSNGISGNYTMPIRLKVSPAAAKVNVHVAVNIQNSSWYRFADGSSSIDNVYSNMINGSVINVDFQIQNIAPLKNTPLIMWVYTNDVSNPVADIDPKSYKVI